LTHVCRKEAARVRPSRGDSLERCPICVAKSPSRERWARLDSEHPGEARRLKALTSLAYGSFLGIFLGVIAVLSGAFVLLNVQNSVTGEKRPPTLAIDDRFTVCHLRRKAG